MAAAHMKERKTHATPQPTKQIAFTDDARLDHILRATATAYDQSLVDFCMMRSSADYDKDDTKMVADANISFLFGEVRPQEVSRFSMRPMCLDETKQVFWDIGCGYGKILVVAFQYFEHLTDVVGIEACSTRFNEAVKHVLELAHSKRLVFFFFFILLQFLFFFFIYVPLDPSPPPPTHTHTLNGSLVSFFFLLDGISM